MYGSKLLSGLTRRRQTNPADLIKYIASDLALEPEIWLRSIDLPSLRSICRLTGFPNYCGVGFKEIAVTYTLPNLDSRISNASKAT
jgi:hypothetical protein